MFTPKIFLVTLVLGFSFAATADAQNVQAEGIVANGKPLELTISQMLKEYELNKVAAEQKYHGKRVVIHGSLNNNVMRHSNGKISSDIAEKWPSVSNSIRCYFDDTPKINAAIGALRGGSIVTVQGFFEGKMPSSLSIMSSELIPTETTSANTWSGVASNRTANGTEDAVIMIAFGIFMLTGACAGAVWAGIKGGQSWGLPGALAGVVGGGAGGAAGGAIALVALVILLLLALAVLMMVALIAVLLAPPACVCCCCSK